jgi:hypothetical protein
MIKPRYTLITNLDYVVIGAVRTYTHALLVERGDSVFNRGEPQYKLRGFGTDPALPTFDMVIPTDEFELVAAQSNAIFVGGDGEPRPLFGGAIMRIAGAPEIQLIAAGGSRQPIDVHRFSEDTHVDAVWELLSRKVAEHWSAPNMPLLQWVSSAAVRQALGRRSS